MIQDEYRYSNIHICSKQFQTPLNKYKTIENINENYKHSLKIKSTAKFFTYTV